MEHILYADTEPIAIVSDEDTKKSKYIHYLEVTRTVFDALFHKKTRWFITFDSGFVQPAIKEDFDRLYRVSTGDFLHLTICHEQKNESTELENVSIIGKIDDIEDFFINGENGLKIVLNKESLKNIESTM